jgi:hypothetical protein
LLSFLDDCLNMHCWRDGYYDKGNSGGGDDGRNCAAAMRQPE